MDVRLERAIPHMRRAPQVEFSAIVRHRYSTKARKDTRVADLD